MLWATSTVDLEILSESREPSSRRTLMLLSMSASRTSCLAVCIHILLSNPRIHVHIHTCKHARS